ncbi:hypothetical protein QR680_012411 [Steinernema hermaphroditum]|uniref:BTB domain-containing protein n=1 Tax=Steinernema hermaphroditum TaxID=289476 RepID=A0AA39M0G9_9BILA|nr:hypothetical protein QR680_012411 [Steinernema hermaphroditum]
MLPLHSGKLVWDVSKTDFQQCDFVNGPREEIGDFTWSLMLDGWDRSMSILCEPTGGWQGKLWRCEANGTVSLVGIHPDHTKKRNWECFDIDHCSLDWDHRVKMGTKRFGTLFDLKYLQSDLTYRYEVTVNITRSISVDFFDPNNKFVLGPNDAACLQIEDWNFFVSKSFFSSQSCYFNALFNAGFKEKGQDVIIVHKVACVDFWRFLSYLYPFNVNKNFEVVRKVIGLADMFMCDLVLKKCEDILLEHQAVELKHLDLADKYNLCSLRRKAVRNIPHHYLRKYAEENLHNPDCRETRKLIVDELDVSDQEDGDYEPIAKFAKTT